jgi:hypothetical protein
MRMRMRMGMGDLLQISIVRVVLYSIVERVLVELCTSIRCFSAIQYWSHGITSIPARYNRVIQQVDYTRCYSTILDHTVFPYSFPYTPPRSAYSCMVRS